VSLRTGLVHMKIEPEFGAHDPALALEMLVEFGLNKKLAGCRPARLEVADEDLGAYLVRALGDGGLAFTVSRDLRAVEQLLAHYTEHVNKAPLPPDSLLAMGRDGEAGALPQRFEGDISAAWKYGWALWTFRREGDSELARQRLREAVRANRHVPRYLTGKAEWPGPLPGSYALGSEEEAVICADELGDAWRRTPGAEHWLNAVKPKKKSPARRRR